jgi:hypothetical protein
VVLLSSTEQNEVVWRFDFSPELRIGGSVKLLFRGRVPDMRQKFSYGKPLESQVTGSIP